METGKIELTPEQKGVLAALSQETGEPVSTLIDKALEELQEHMRAGRAQGEQERHSTKKTPKPIWEVFADTKDIPEAEWNKLPTDLATQHDHYIYHTPKRPV
jgi:predicted DNA-binding protein